jgi:transcriptional regulator with XRE-family HTH domain
MAMPSGSQIRAARGLLGWSASELAERSEVTLRTIQRFETAEGVPPNRSGTLDKVRVALEAQGIEFLGDPETSPGVRLRRKS